MNKIQQLKIKNYKKKLLNEYQHLDVDHIYYGDENIENFEFFRKAHNSDSGRYIKESIFIKDKGFFLSECEIFDISKVFVLKNIRLLKDSKINFSNYLI